MKIFIRHDLQIWTLVDSRISQIPVSEVLQVHDSRSSQIRDLKASQFHDSRSS
jgi:predicted XRE-type DNA-binding protein